MSSDKYACGCGEGPRNIRGECTVHDPSAKRSLKLADEADALRAQVAEEVRNVQWLLRRQNQVEEENSRLRSAMWNFIHMRGGPHEKRFEKQLFQILEGGAGDPTASLRVEIEKLNKDLAAKEKALIDLSQRYADDTAELQRRLKGEEDEQEGRQGRGDGDADASDDHQGDRREAHGNGRETEQG